MILDIWLRSLAFFKRLLKQFGEPRVIVTDKAASLKSAFNHIQKQGFYSQTEHRTIKYLNNLIEQDHRPIKKRSRLYKSLCCAHANIKGMETVHALYKKHRKGGNLFGFSV